MIKFSDYIKQAVEIHNNNPEDDAHVARGLELTSEVSDEIVEAALASFGFDDEAAARWLAGLTLGYVLLTE